MWKLTAKGLRVEPIAGIPWRELSDEEFEAAEAEMDARFPDQPGCLRASGFFEEGETPIPQPLSPSTEKGEQEEASPSTGSGQSEVNDG